jgi:lipoprotein-anchoring transpeptidase ErfK/SrfK
MKGRIFAKWLSAAAFVGLAGAHVSGLTAYTPAPAPYRVPGPDIRPAVHQASAAAKPSPPAQTDRFAVKRVLQIDGPFRHGDYVWDDAGVPQGPLIITVDLKAQTLSVFRDGYEIGAAVILYGIDDKPTPTGTFFISQKDADHVSNLYDAPMPYMLRLTDDGISIHGSEVGVNEATHGCIGVPTAFAKRLFGQAKLGDRVIITDGKMMDLGSATAG